MFCVQGDPVKVVEAHATRWVALVTQDCSEEQPIEVKQAAAEVLVKVTPTLLTSAILHMGTCLTILGNLCASGYEKCSEYMCLFVYVWQVSPTPWHYGVVSLPYCRTRTRT